MISSKRTTMASDTKTNCQPGAATAAGWGFAIAESMRNLGPLTLRDRRRRLKGDAKINILTVGDPPLDSAGEICARADMTTALLEGVIMFRPAHARRGKSRTDFETFGGGQTQHRFGEIGFEFVENGFAQPGWNISRNAFNHATQRIARGPRLLNEIDHVLRGCPIGTTNDRCFHLRSFDFGPINFRNDFVNLRNEGDDFDFWEERRQHLAGNGCGGDATDRFARAGAAAALPVSDPVFGLVGEIGVRRTKSFAHCFVRFRPRVLVSNKNCYRGTKSFPFENTRHNLTAIGLLSLRCYSALTGTTTIEFSLNLSARKRNPWRTTIDDHTDTATVRFAESGDAKKLAKAVAHLGLKNKSTRRDHNQGTC